VLRSRMNGAIPPFPNTPSWRGAQLKQRYNFTLPLTLVGWLVGLVGLSVGWWTLKSDLQKAAC